MCWFCSGLPLNVRFSVISRVLATKLYAAFWDVLILGCAPIFFGKLLIVGFWSYYHVVVFFPN